MPLNESIEYLAPGKALLVYLLMKEIQGFVACTRTGNYKEEREADSEKAKRYLRHAEGAITKWDKREYKNCYSALAKLYAISDTINMEKLRKLAGL